jgi:hypothetical protein
MKTHIFKEINLELTSGFDCPHDLTKNLICLRKVNLSEYSGIVYLCNKAKFESSIDAIEFYIVGEIVGSRIEYLNQIPERYPDASRVDFYFEHYDIRPK